MKVRARLFRISFKITLMVVVIVVVSMSAIGVLSYFNYRTSSVDALSDNLLAVARSAAGLIDPAQYVYVMRSGVANDYHYWLSEQFTNIVNMHGLFFLHAGELDSYVGFTGFVEAQIPGFGTGLGEITPVYQYPEEAFRAMNYGGAYVSEPMYAEDYGLGAHAAIILAAYAPVFDAYGNTIAIVSASLIDTSVYASARAFATRMLVLGLLGMFVLLWIPIFFARRNIGVPISKLSAAANAIVGGDLSGEVDISLNDELGLLADNFSIMQASIQEKIEVERTAHQADLARGRAEAVAEAMRESVTYASKIQRNLLPTDDRLGAAFSDFSVIWEPRDIVGGDIYWFRRFDRGSVLCVADCTGHGTPGALLTMLVVSKLDAIVQADNCDDTAGIVFELDRRLSGALHVRSEFDIMNINDGCDIAVVFVSNDGNISFSAGNTNIFVCNGVDVVRLRGQKLLIGEGRLSCREDVQVFCVPFNPVNRFFIASDGLYDQPGGEFGRAYGLGEFRRLLVDCHDKDLDFVLGKVWGAFEAYRGDESRVDDFTLFAFKPRS